ncbi:MAG: hypothetical protein JEZ07_09220 [Phycisphaerae bacterium]|nr:hypothetical protein [Phycisphaerae bacterium]
MSKFYYCFLIIFILSSCKTQTILVDSKSQADIYHLQRSQVKSTMDNLLKALASKSYGKLTDFVEPSSADAPKLSGDAIAARILGPNYSIVSIGRWVPEGFIVNFDDPQTAQVQFTLNYKPAPYRKEISNIINFTFHYSIKHQKWFLVLK